METSTSSSSSLNSTNSMFSNLSMTKTTTSTAATATTNTLSSSSTDHYFTTTRANESYPLVPLPEKQFPPLQQSTPPFSVSSDTDLSSIKELYDYIRCFEIEDTRDFHNNDDVKRYARFHLNLTLKFMGCKSIHARQITNTVFEQFEKFGHLLSCYQYSKPQYITDFPVASEVQDKKHSFTILLGGTSGCGKSTLTALLASRIGFAAVISTDNIRQLLRKFISRSEAPILWASTYHAGEIISDPSLSHKEKILQGYQAQNEMIFHKLDVLIDHYEKRKESLIVEGVHLDTRLIVRLVKKHPSCIPFLMYISNEDKHKERFAIRSKYMTLDPHQNKYTKYFKNIRIINDFLCQGADEYMIPQIDNTSIDRSLATIIGTIFACIKRKVSNGESYFNQETNKLSMVYNEYEQIQHQFWSSKGMLRLIQRKRFSVGQNQHNETEEAFNSDDDEDVATGNTIGSDLIKKQLNSSSNRSKTHSSNGDGTNPTTNPDVDDTSDSDSISDSDSEDPDRIDFYLDCGSLGS
eukprot:gene2018-2485_t